MEYIILDLEWNAAYSRRRGGFINEIIEFGAVKVDDEFNITKLIISYGKPVSFAVLLKEYACAYGCFLE